MKEDFAGNGAERATPMSLNKALLAFKCQSTASSSLSENPLVWLAGNFCPAASPRDLGSGPGQASRPQARARTASERPLSKAADGSRWSAWNRWDGFMLAKGDKALVSTHPS